MNSQYSEEFFIEVNRAKASILESGHEEAMSQTVSSDTTAPYTVVNIIKSTTATTCEGNNTTDADPERQAILCQIRDCHAWHDFPDNLPPRLYLYTANMDKTELLDILHLAQNYPFDKARELLDLELFMASRLGKPTKNATATKPTAPKASSPSCRKPMETMKRETIVKHNQRNAKRMKAVAPTPKLRGYPLPTRMQKQASAKPKPSKPAAAISATTSTTSTTDTDKISRRLNTSPVSDITEISTTEAEARTASTPHTTYSSPEADVDDSTCISAPCANRDEKLEARQRYIAEKAGWMLGMDEAEIPAVGALMKMNWDVTGAGLSQQHMPGTRIYRGEHLRSALSTCNENKESLEVLPASVQEALEFFAGFVENVMTHKAVAWRTSDERC